MPAPPFHPGRKYCRRHYASLVSPPRHFRSDRCARERITGSCHGQRGIMQTGVALAHGSAPVRKSGSNLQQLYELRSPKEIARRFAPLPRRAAGRASRKIGVRTIMSRRVKKPIRTGGSPQGERPYRGSRPSATSLYVRARQRYAPRRGAPRAQDCAHCPEPGKVVRGGAARQRFRPWSWTADETNSASTAFSRRAFRVSRSSQ